MKGSVINLERHTARWATFAPLVAEGLVERVDAVRGDELVLERLEAAGLVALAVGDRLRRNTMRADDTAFSNLNQVACALSHTRLWQRLLEEDGGDDAALIMEDDACPTSDTLRGDVPRLRAWMDANHPAWGFVVLTPFAVFWDRSGPPAEEAWPGVFVGRMARWYGLACYLVSRRGAAAVLPLVVPLEAQVDSALRLCDRLGHVEVYGVSRGKPEPYLPPLPGLREHFVPLSAEAPRSGLGHELVTLAVLSTGLGVVSAALLVIAGFLACVLARASRTGRPGPAAGRAAPAAGRRGPG